MPEEMIEDDLMTRKSRTGSLMGKMLLVILLALVSSAGGGVVSFVLINRTLGAQAKAAERPENADQQKEAEILERSAVIPLEPFIVNLADTDAARYLRIRISLMLDDKTKVKEVSENQALQLKVRDVILDSLTAKRSQDLINSEGKKNLRREIQEKVAVYFREPKLVDVMFTEFVIQL